MAALSYQDFVTCLHYSADMRETQKASIQQAFPDRIRLIRA